jgi:hypothetical protein
MLSFIKTPDHIREIIKQHRHGATSEDVRAFFMLHGVQLHEELEKALRSFIEGKLK